MALSDQKILREIKSGDIIIHPFNPANLSTSSYDVTLGPYYFQEQHRSKHHHNIYNIWSQEHTEYIWGKSPLRAEKAKLVFQKYNFDWKGISPQDEVILIEPGETLLCHTNEFIGGKNHITTMMKARSSMGRSFIEVCKCAGWGDVGYINRWTMEITNNSQRYAIPLVVGRRIAQIVFFETGPILEKDYSTSGKYQSSNSIKDLEKNWSPNQMLPRLYKDKEITK